MLKWRFLLLSESRRTPNLFSGKRAEPVHVQCGWEGWGWGCCWAARILDPSKPLGPPGHMGVFNLDIFILKGSAYHHLGDPVGISVVDLANLFPRSLPECLLCPDT